MTSLRLLAGGRRRAALALRPVAAGVRGRQDARLIAARAAIQIAELGHLDGVRAIHGWGERRRIVTIGRGGALRVTRRRDRLQIIRARRALVADGPRFRCY